MTVLTPQGPLEGLDLHHGNLKLSAVALGRVSWIAPYPGTETALSHALQAACSMSFPGPGESRESTAGRILWSGRAQALLIGPQPSAAIEKCAAVVDQTDGWAAMRLTGYGAARALARLTPLDLRPSHFSRGRTARSLLGQVPGLIIANEDGFEILVMCSMAETARHEIENAMRSVAAREDIPKEPA
ncbi:sarcosine oxidase subunit gamma [Aliiruegeria sabulilitoris]|uniref:sarcosine oxidase subunit gamma n=1 Tax=Aliiruegeria sabulilitoris TaxID=1510458 RepID=UPI00082F319C|nr:hypothetical protein [Aliiruegeria sabulilitoris]NDR59608.1 sarcosine oxidase subunit gamma [Pseudoruegeria sp. M32A2M]